MVLVISMNDGRIFYNQPFLPPVLMSVSVQQEYRERYSRAYEELRPESDS